jgi:fatty acid desaturase
MNTITQTSGGITPVTMKMVQDIVGDLRTPRPSIYFVDLLLSAGLGWVLWFVAVADSAGVWGWLAGLLSCFLLFRGLAFIHELVHQRDLVTFRYLWHALIGIPLLVPLLLYQPTHQGHHSPGSYGTKTDGEYDDLRGRFFSMSARLLLLSFALPFGLAIRFGVLVPLSIFIPYVRKEVLPKKSVHMSFRFPFEPPKVMPIWEKEFLITEYLCMPMAWLLAYGLYAGHARWVVGWYGVLVVIAMLNMVRALVTTHLYVENDTGRNAGDQLADSLNIAGGGLLTLLMCPTGLRYHALHHVAAYLPYHALGEAHRRLIEKLPTNSAYHYASVSNILVGWRRVIAATAKPTAA